MVNTRLIQSFQQHALGARHNRYLWLDPKPDRKEEQGILMLSKHLAQRKGGL